MSGREIVVVANRLPVDRCENSDGTSSWHTSPGGLVSAMEPIVKELGCIWVGWSGATDELIPSFEFESMRLVPVSLSEAEVEQYYEGFSNGTLWPLYHDLIAQPVFHRNYWESYQRVNRRFAETVAKEAPVEALVWVHDYQLQLLPEMLRQARPDLTIAFFLHIPFPSTGLFAQLPWRREVVQGILGADLVGFQSDQDAQNFRFASERFSEARSHGNFLILPPPLVSRSVPFWRRNSQFPSMPVPSTLWPINQKSGAGRKRFERSWETQQPFYSVWTDSITQKAFVIG